MSIRLMIGALAVQAALVVPQLAGAATLVPTVPDIQHSVSVVFTTGMLSVTGTSGFLVELDGDGGEELRIFGSYLILAFVSPDGTFGGGTLAVSGNLTDPLNNPLGSGNMLLGDLTDFKFTNGGTVDEFEFLFDVTFHRAALPFGTKGGILITAPAGQSQFQGVFETDEPGDKLEASGEAHTFAMPVPVPTPAAVAGGAGLLAGMAAFRRRGRGCEMTGKGC